MRSEMECSGRAGTGNEDDDDCMTTTIDDNNGKSKGSMQAAFRDTILIVVGE